MLTCPANLRSVLSRSSVRSSDTASKDDWWTEGSRRASSTLVHALLIVLFFAGHSCGQSVTEPLPDNAQLPADAIWQFGENESSYNGLYKLAYSADGEYLAARNSDNIVTVYDTKTHQPLQTFAGHDQPIQCVDFSKDGTYVLTGANGQRDDRKTEHTKIWNVQTGELKLDLNIQAYAAFFSSDGENVLIMDEKAVNTVRISDGKLLVKKIWKQSNERPLTMSRDGNRVAFYRSPVAGRAYTRSGP